MLPHEQKHQNNICEYLLYLLETQEMIREKGFDPEKIRAYALDYSRIPVVERSLLADWYLKIALQMKEAEIEMEGNLPRIIELFRLLAELNFELIRSDQVYRLMFDKAKISFPGIPVLHSLPVGPPFTHLFSGFKEITQARRNEDLERVKDLESINEMLSYLSFKYKQRYHKTEKDAA